MKKFVCPYCYEKHNFNTIKLKCSYNVIGKKETCWTDVKKDSFGWVDNAQKFKCKKCTRAKKIFFCPVTNKEIPSDLLRGKYLSIALIGAKASGKSNYIGVLIDEIRKKMSVKFKTVLNTTASEESLDYYNRNYYDPLFKKGSVVDATSKEEIPPLIFPLRFMNKKEKRITNVVSLLFYDTAGENLDSPDDILVNNRYISNADGIIILLDPLQIPYIREKLSGKINLPAQNTDTTEILSRVVDIIRNVKNIKGIIKIPLALAFTKMDALEENGILREDSFLKNESEHLYREKFVQTDFENINIEIEDLLHNWLNVEITQQAKNFKEFAFFGLSALGSVPIDKGTKLKNGKVTPKRVLDPLLWLLAKNKYIKTVKK